MKKYLLEGVVFVCGAVVMIYEIVGSRIVSPFLGSSLITWTSIIGVILASLSIGYYFGGKVADKRADFKVFSSIVFISPLPGPVFSGFNFNVSDQIQKKHGTHMGCGSFRIGGRF